MGNRRSRLISATSIALVVVALPLWVRLALQQGFADPTVRAFLVGSFAIGLNPLLLRQKLTPRFVGGLLSSELALVLGFMAWHNGGLQAGALPWTLTLPIIGAFLVGPRFGAALGIGVTAEILFFYLAAREGFVFPQPFAGPEMERWRALGFTSVAIFLTVLAWMYETSRDMAHQELVEARERAERAAWAKDRFLANMSHEVRTPLNAIIGLSSLLRDSELSAEQRTTLATIETSGEALLSVVSDILSYSRLEGDQRSLSETVFDLHGLIEQTVSMVRASVPTERVGLKSTADAEVPRLIIGSAGPLRQVLTNLLVNAMKFTDTGEVRVRTRVQADRLRIEVVDTGIGIPPDRVDRIFDAFAQVDDAQVHARGGAGLGLAISRRYVQSMGGELTVESTLHEGSVFTIDLPLRAVPDASTATPSTPPGIPKLRILVAEDNPVNRKIIEAMLRKLGQSPDLVEDGEQAVRRVRSGAYDLVLMDMQMPVMDGLQAAREISELPHPPRLIACTAHDLPVERRRCKEAGMEGFLTKPIRIAQLQAVLRERG